MANGIRELAVEDYKAGMSYPDIANKHGISLGTVKSWASRHWKKTEMQPSATATKKVAPTQPVATTPKQLNKIISDAVEENDELTEKQKEFCVIFIRNRNATQAYLKSHDCNYNTAMVEGHRLLRNPKVKAEIRRLKEIKNEALGDFSGDDIVELHMRIAFADITDYVEFENKLEPVLKNNEPVYAFKEDGEAFEVMRSKNELRLKPGTIVDGVLINGITEGREGVNIRLADKQRSLAFLERWFELNPMDKHRKNYDNRVLDLKEKELEGKSEPVITPSMEQYAAFKMAESYLWEMCRLRLPKLYTDEATYLKEWCQALQDFENDDNELLILEGPPRHGKTVTAKNAVQWYLGRNPSLRVIGASYNQKLARKLSKAIRNDIGETKASEKRIVFSDIFPGAKLKRGSAQVDLWQLDGSEQENYLATSPKSTSTGFGAEIVIIDDIIKNAYEANHKELLDDIYEWFTDTLYSRLEGKGKVILIMTRWATKDLIGRVVALYEEQGRKVRRITKKAFDGNRMLNPQILNKERYDNLIQTIGEDIVKANYDQEPIDLKGRLYGEFVTYEESELPKKIDGTFTVVDVADEGKDYLAAITYKQTGEKSFARDIYYTQDGQEQTEGELAQRLIDFGVDEALFESNSGGKSYSRHVEREYLKRCKEQGEIAKCQFKTFTQTKNKEARILSQSTAVIRRVYMPALWQKMWPRAHTDIVEYQRMGGNAHDDIQDALTMIVERHKEERNR